MTTDILIITMQISFASSCCTPNVIPLCFEYSCHNTSKPALKAKTQRAVRTHKHTYDCKHNHTCNTQVKQNGTQLTFIAQPIRVLIWSCFIRNWQKFDGSSFFFVRSMRCPMPPVKSTSASSDHPPLIASYDPTNLNSLQSSAWCCQNQLQRYPRLWIKAYAVIVTH